MGVRLTSIAAYRELVESGKQNTQAARIIKIVANRANVSLQEIAQTYRANYKWIELSSVSARVKELKDKGVLKEEILPRKCLVTKITINPVRIA